VKWLLSDSKIFFTLCLISVTIFLLDNLKFLELPKSGLQVITSPIQYGVYKTSLGLSHQFEFLTFSRRIYQENVALKKQLAQVLSENANLQTKIRQQEAELQQKSSTPDQSFNLLSAKIIGVGRYLTLDKGQADNLKVGQAVIFKDNLIGVIKAVSSKTAQVLLPTDPDSRIAVFTQNEVGRARGILEGQFSSEQLMNKILHQEPIQQENIIYSEGTEGTIPRGLVIGRVLEVLEQQNQLFKQAKVIGIISPFDLDLVFVITEK